MDSFDQTTRFHYNPNSNTGGNTEFSGILEIYVHNARNLHNICIYDNQDVYAKFSLTYNPDETFSTRIINGGGQNPEFNDKLVVKIAHQLDPVLKCEMWMLSRAKNYMEDQLLGFVLVPISLVAGKGKVTQDFSLSSTDLFHSPAGTIKLSLSLTNSTNLLFDPRLSSFPDSVTSSSISSEVVLLDRKISEVALDPVEYSRIEFPDINVVRENQQMACEYFGLSSISGSFLCLGVGASDQPVDDYEMAANSSDENRGGSVSPNGSTQNSEFLSSTMTSLSDDNKMGKTNPNASIISGEINRSLSTSPVTPTSKNGNEVRTGKRSHRSVKEQESNEELFSAPVGNINLEAEQSAMQQQIVDMYMRSMQQFTESLAKMKLPMELDKPEDEDRGNVVQIPHEKSEVENKKKDGSRVFYGSRAFF